MASCTKRCAYEAAGAEPQGGLGGPMWIGKSCSTLMVEQVLGRSVFAGQHDHIARQIDGNFIEREIGETDFL